MSIVPPVTVGPASSTPATAGTDAASPARADRMRALAAQFEAILLGQMLRELKSSMFGDEDKEGTGLHAGPLGDALFTEVTLALSRAGGLGVGDALYGPLQEQTAGAGLDAGAGLLGGPAILGAGRGLLDSIPGLVGGGDRFGAAIAPPASLDALRARVTSAYGWREDPIDGGAKFHRGMDIALPEGHDVPSARAGRVSFAGELPGYGLTVVVDHGDGISTRYAHLSAIDVVKDQAVKAGEVIAHSGSTGRATGPHLHFEVLEGGRTVDPRVMLRQWTGAL